MALAATLTKVDRDGNVWVTGPGGVLVISPAGKLLGVINPNEPNGNCCWVDDGSTLYITANYFLVRVKTLTQVRQLGRWAKKVSEERRPRRSCANQGAARSQTM